METAQGIVMKSTGSQYLVKLDDGNLVPCGIRGKFRIKGIRATNPVTVGDHVVFEWSEFAGLQTWPRNTSCWLPMLTWPG